jgi:hypothetical protein
MGFSTGCVYPNPNNNGVSLFPVEIHNATSSDYRGRMPGMLVPMESTNGAFTSGDMSIVINGTTYLALRCHTSSGSINYGNFWLSLNKSHWEIV